jgi:hypothetical protein
VARKCEVEATAWNANNQEAVVSFSWSTRNPAIATVSPKPGFDTMIAQVSGMSEGTTTLRVQVNGQPELVMERTLTVIKSNNPDL